MTPIIVQRTVGRRPTRPALPAVVVNALLAISPIASITVAISRHRKARTIARIDDRRAVIDDVLAIARPVVVDVPIVVGAVPNVVATADIVVADIAAIDIPVVDVVAR